MPTSFGDFFKPNKDLNKFDSKKTFTLKAKAADKTSLKTKFTLGKGLSIEGGKKTDLINYKKVSANTDGHFEVELELNDAIADVTVGANVKVGSSNWQQKGNAEELVINLGYGGISDLAFQMDTDVLASNSITSELDLSYQAGDFLVGSKAKLGLPFALSGSGGVFEVSGVAVGAKWTSGNLAIGAAVHNVTDMKNTAKGKGGKLHLDIFHKANSDTNWSAHINSNLKSKRPEDLNATLAMDTKLDATTSFAFGLNNAGIANLKYAQNVSSKMKMTYQCTVDLNSTAKDQQFGIGIEMSA
jgi:hypothetical protein